MSDARRGLILIVALAAILLAGCGTTIRATTTAIGTGRTLTEDQQSITLRSAVYPFPLISSVFYRKGLQKRLGGGRGLRLARHHCRLRR